MALAMWTRPGPQDGIERGERSYVSGSVNSNIAMMKCRIRATITGEEGAARGPLADFAFCIKAGQPDGPAAELRVEDPWDLGPLQRAANNLQTQRARPIIRAGGGNPARFSPRASRHCR